MSDTADPLTTFAIEVPSEIWDCPRAEALGSFCEFLETAGSGLIALPPGEIVVELCAEPIIPARWGLTVSDAVGCFVIRDPHKGLSDHWRVLVAVGSEADDRAAGHEWSARLETLPHELGHVAEFWARHGAVPRSAHAAGADLRQEPSAEDEERIEDEAKRITTHFMDWLRGVAWSGGDARA